METITLEINDIENIKQFGFAGGILVDQFKSYFSTITFALKGEVKNPVEELLMKEGFKKLTVVTEFQKINTINYINLTRKTAISFVAINNFLSIVYLEENKEYIDKLESLLSPLFYRKIESHQKINLLTYNSGSYYLKAIDFGKSKGIKDKYPKKFTETNKHIIKSLNKQRQGIILLHGIPGTGKTSYIKYLTSVVKRDFILVPQTLAYSLISPNFTAFLLENRNSVLIIEDAEKAVSPREESQGSAVSDLLNLSDGLVGQAVNCSIICTFNTELKNIDKALLRKGRLIAEHEFKPLNTQEAIVLFNKLKKPVPDNIGSMTIADIYNYEQPTFIEQKERQTIGFQRA